MKDGDQILCECGCDEVIIAHRNSFPPYGWVRFKRGHFSRTKDHVEYIRTLGKKYGSATINKWNNSAAGRRHIRKLPGWLGAKNEIYEGIIADKLTRWKEPFTSRKIFHCENIRFTVDFHLTARNIALEIDGRYHYSRPRRIHDSDRDWWLLMKHDLRTVRIRNHMVRRLGKAAFYEIVA